jgi:F0F1-type ATP synthase assembly protein I
VVVMTMGMIVPIIIGLIAGVCFVLLVVGE